MSVSDGTPIEVAKAASISARSIAILPSKARNDALTAIHKSLSAAKDSILAANAKDVESATTAAAGGQLSQSVLKRLDLSRKGKWEDMLQGILDVRELDDPGGKESTESFVAISSVISEALKGTEVSNSAIQLLKTRNVIPELLALDKFVDLVIPRGSNDLVTYIKNNTKIPVLGHADGLCSTYIQADADMESAVKIIMDAKLGYPAACNSLETLLVDETALATVLPSVASALLSKGVALRCDERSKEVLVQSLSVMESRQLQDSVEADYSTEFLDLILAVKTIPTAGTPEAAVDLAIAHINAHSSKHTDAILTPSRDLARRFQSGVDSACVFWNTSTRMADGMRFGFGTEVGISTNKIHARGPVGLEGLMIYKYFISGAGQAAADYHEGEGGRRWKHERLPLR